MWFNIWITGFVFTLGWLLCDESTKDSGSVNLMGAATWPFWMPILLAWQVGDLVMSQFRKSDHEKRSEENESRPNREDC